MDLGNSLVRPNRNQQTESRKGVYTAEIARSYEARVIEAREELFRQLIAGQSQFLTRDLQIPIELAKDLVRFFNRHLTRD
jgi:hypothetical protein